MPLPELTVTGKENGVVNPSTTDDTSPSKKLRTEPASASSPSAAAPTVPDVGTNATSTTGDDDTHQETNEDDDEEAAYWKRQFYDLRNKRETEAETQYQVLKDRTQQREKSLKAYIRDIEEQLAEAKGTIKASAAALAAAEAAAAAAETSAASAAAEAAAKAAETEQSKESNDNTDNSSGIRDQLSEASTTIRIQKQIISHYKMLTGIKVDNVTSQSLDVTVRNVKRGTAANFRLTSVRSTAANSTGEEISLRLDPLEGTEHLPEYMRTAIEFEVDQCPTLMREVLDNMFPDEE
mmetsp:Transcript_20706/g.45207  ORF Transcript_20706/g.45207 Transcript_20706/m.45207 type:complete len:294 (+) Transcript_20706:165-1046(+)